MLLPLELAPDVEPIVNGEGTVLPLADVELIMDSVVPGSAAEPGIDDAGDGNADTDAAAVWLVGL